MKIPPNRNSAGPTTGFACALTCYLLLLVSPAQANEAMDDETWNHSLAVYLWGAGVGGKTNSGSGLDVSFSDLLDNLEFGAMGAYQAKKGKWSIMTDVIYLDVANEETASPGSGLISPEGTVSVELESWVVQAGAAYSFWQNSSGSSVGLIFGARYLDMSTEILAQFEPILPGIDPELELQASEGILDFFAGFHGVAALNDRWFVPWGINAGAGDSKLTWAAIAGIGFRASERTEVLLTYRHQEWDFDDTLIVDNLKFSGPMLGAVFRF